MSPSAVPSAARQGRQSVMEAVATGPDARCILRYAQSAARILKYPLNLAVIGRFTVVIATAKSDRADSSVSNLEGIHGLRIIGPCMPLECVGVLCR